MCRVQLGPQTEAPRCSLTLMPESDPGQIIAPTRGNVILLTQSEQTVPHSDEKTKDSRSRVNLGTWLCFSSHC